MRLQLLQKFLKIFFFVALVVWCGCEKIADQRKRVYYEQGLKLYEKQDYRRAAKKFQDALVFDKKFFDALYMKGMCSLASGNFKDAANWFKKASTERPEDLAVKLKFLEATVKLAPYEKFSSVFYEKAISYSDEILAIDEQNQEARLLKFRALIELERLDEAQEGLEALVAKGVSTPLVFCMLAETKIKAGAYKEAEDIIVEHYQDSEDWIAVVQQLIKIYQSEKKNAQVEAMYAIIIKHTENQLPYELELVNFFRQNAEENKEEKLLKEMVEKYPDNLQIRLDFINFLLHYNRYKEAKVTLAAEIEKDPENLDLKKTLIDLYVQEHDTEAAINYTTQSLESIAIDTGAYFVLQDILAELYFQSGSYAISKKISQEVLDKRPKDPDARFNLCRLDIIEGNSMRAIGELRLLLRENPGKPTYYYYLGLAHELRGDNILAEKALNDALDSTPDYKEALKKLADFYNKRGLLKELHKRIKKYLELKPDDIEMNAMLADVERKLTGRIVPSEDL